MNTNIEREVEVKPNASSSVEPAIITPSGKPSLGNQTLPKIKETIQRVRDYSRSHPGLFLGGLSALIIAGGLLRGMGRKPVSR